MEYETISSLHNRLSRIHCTELVNLDVKNVKYLKVTFPSGEVKYTIVKAGDDWNSLSFGQGHSTVLEAYAFLDKIKGDHGSCPVTIETVARFNLLKPRPIKHTVTLYESPEFGWGETDLNKAHKDKAKFVAELAKLKSVGGVDSQIIMAWLTKVCPGYPDLQVRVVGDLVLIGDSELKAQYPLATSDDFEKLQPNLWRSKLTDEELRNLTVYEVEGVKFTSLDKVKSAYKLDPSHDISRVFKPRDGVPSAFVCSLNLDSLKLVYGTVN